jgi:cobalamin biosynthetic protein CobC
MLEHGGNLRAASAAFGRPLEDWLDLSAGLNPHWYPVPHVAGNAWHRLPERDPELLAAARGYYGAPELLAVAGTQAAIQALPALRAPSRITVAAPSYAEHAHHWSRHGHTLREVPYELLDGVVDGCDVLVVCNPNNPTGARVTPARLLGWAERLGARGGWLVVDEAFGDTTPELSVAAHTGMPGLIVLRSIGKFFGLAGVRAGFVAAEGALLAALDEALGPWTVSGPAQAICRAALLDRDWQAGTRVRLAQDGARLHGLLRAHGVQAHGCPLFQWWPEARPEDFHHHMAERGIWVRLFRERARGVRLGLPAEEAGWLRLAQALNEWSESP